MPLDTERHGPTGATRSRAGGGQRPGARGPGGILLNSLSRDGPGSESDSESTICPTVAHGPGPPDSEWFRMTRMIMIMATSEVQVQVLRD